MCLQAESHVMGLRQTHCKPEKLHVSQCRPSTGFPSHDIVLIPLTEEGALEQDEMLQRKKFIPSDWQDHGFFFWKDQMTPPERLQERKGLNVSSGWAGCPTRDDYLEQYKNILQKAIYPGSIRPDPASLKLFRKRMARGLDWSGHALIVEEGYGLRYDLAGSGFGC